MEEESLSFRILDSTSAVLYLDVPRSQVVLLQVFFELYDGLAAVRTVSSPPTTPAAPAALVCILTTPDAMRACGRVLQAIRKHVSWRVGVCDNDPFILSAY
jgi:hypothetical protein